MFKKKGKKKFNNAFNVSNEKAEEIFRLSNEDLINRTHLEYRNWTQSQKLKKEDAAIARVKQSIKDINEEIKANPEYVKIEEEFKRKKEELVSEELATLKEELKNVAQPYNEDIKCFRNIFRLGMHEITKRKEAGSWVAKTTDKPVQ